ncbi:helix-turn-helix domain-containing protein [Agrobacterium larrymoorei]|uniref:Helix-turn-helix domain-containing protein n=1 Tax=Agrobacterium larrymoorei TaxID=160699 RepID=A0AAF0HFB6_9HYPH|nr:helix-turn-helix domain-containing protein [Agrobacterium larrymoorei]WHA43620.1 helix-turn-helix domain-containing protein [Agrobacterium larrymoorei]
MARLMEDRLYGEKGAEGSSFRFHCETLFSRSSLHRFEIGRHRHESFLQILYIAGGTGDAILGADIRPIEPPAIAIVPPGFEHGFRFSRDISGIVMTIIPDALSPSVQAMLRQNLKRPALLSFTDAPTSDAIIASCEIVAEEYISRKSGWDALVEAHICALVVHLSRTVSASSERAPIDTQDERIQTLLDLIIRNIREPRSADYYAAELGVSPTHLNRIVKRHWGTSLQRLIARQQIENAKHELLFTFSSVRMVAASMGFNDPAYFSRFFLKETGMTPKAWRLAEQQKLSPSPSHQASILESSA